MTLTVADIERWDGGDVREVFHAATSRAQAAFDAADGLASLPAFSSWGGAAAEAAREAIGRTRKDLDVHGNEALAVAQAAGRAADSIDQIKSDLAALKADAEDSGLEIDPYSNRVVPIPGSTHGRREMQSKIPGLQVRLNSIVEQADSVDSALAASINMADGKVPIPPPTSPAQLSPADAQRRQNERDAFKQATGRDPVTASDWETAAMLDPHSYDPKNQGVPASVVVGRIQPVPGQGIVRTNLFIPGEKAWTPLGDNLGDNRGFNPAAGPEDSRVSIVTDYDNGLVVVRQNPSIFLGDNGNQLKAGHPDVRVSQSPNGSVLINYAAADPFSPGGESLAKATPWNVQGRLAISPGLNGPVAGGLISDFPAVEIYRDSGGQAVELGKIMPQNTSLYGPVAGLHLTQSIGQTDLLDQFPAAVSPTPMARIPPVILPYPSVSLGPVAELTQVPVGR
ncbi:hypothetical protein [Mycolicibacterium komossense]|uniref:ESX-1 secretion-associated protein EspA/EspE-like domain-containing protein n=1 Tax=Mycolicibacterium komossense TaxID=1779 RepID=A0ABT3C8V2_9MYCO|nr:hypothetical protein [Mycolicibacterium komossense]MCV7225887.1 hypothetical protein [Mycolicibacterium komossense]